MKLVFKSRIPGNYKISIYILLIILLSGCNNIGVKEDFKYNVPLPLNVKGRYEEEYKLKTNYTYNLDSIHEVDGRQGIAYENDTYYVSGNSTLSKYNSNWELLSSSNRVFEKFKTQVNHIGDIDVYNKEIYAGVEYFMDGGSKNIQIAVYDADNFELKRTYEIDTKSNQTEVSGIAIDPDTNSIWMCSWADGESGRYLYRYNLEDGKYIDKYHLQAPPQWIQGIAYLNGYIYITADDGTADLGEADHIYRVKVDVSKSAFPVFIERTLDDVRLQGEIEGITFNPAKKQLLVSYNRGSQIVSGMVKGLYEGYNKEIREIYIYNMK